MILGMNEGFLEDFDKGDIDIAYGEFLETLQK